MTADATDGLSGDAGVVYYAHEDALPARGRDVAGARAAVRVVDADSLTAAHALHMRDLQPVVLNFASARNPGGGYRVGARGQEEDLCRQTPLAAALESDAARPFYAAGEDAGLMNTHAVVYVRRVEVYGTEGRPAWSCAVVSSAAPPARQALLARYTRDDVRAALVVRARRIIDVALAQGHDALVLGAWGTGAFACEPSDVAEAFDGALDGAGGDGGLREAVFAIAAARTERWVLRAFEVRLCGTPR